MDAAPGAPRDLNPAAPPPVTVGLVTFNAAGLLPRTLPRLLAVTQYPAVRWLVVDNASADGTADLLARDFPAVQVERLPANLGYPAAVNRLVARADTEYVAQVNPDVLVEPDWLAPLVAALERQPSAAQAGGRILRPDGTTQYCGSRLHPLYALLGTRGARDPGARPARVDFHSPLFLVRRAAWQAVGGFSEVYTPGYYEDAELGFAFRRAGWPVWYVPECRAVHLDAATFGRLPRRDFMRLYERNRLLFVFRNYPRSWLAVHLAGEGLKALQSLAGGYGAEYCQAWAAVRQAWPAIVQRRTALRGGGREDLPSPG